MHKKWVLRLSVLYGRREAAQISGRHYNTVRKWELHYTGREYQAKFLDLLTMRCFGIAASEYKQHVESLLREGFED